VECSSQVEVEVAHSAKNYIISITILYQIIPASDKALTEIGSKAVAFIINRTMGLLTFVDNK